MRLARLVPLLLLFVATIASSQAIAPSAAEVYGSGARRFTARFPAAPTVEEGGPDRSFLGSTSWVYHSGRMRVEVTAMESRADLTDVDRALAPVASINKVAAIVQDPQVVDIEIDGNPGKAVSGRMRDGDAMVRGQTLVVGRTMFLVLAAGRPSDDAAVRKQLDDFVTSFRPLP